MDARTELFNALRRINRALEIYSRHLERDYGLTATQILVLREIRTHGALTIGGLAHQISLGQTTVTEIINRLEGRGLLKRKRAAEDRRRVLIHLTENGRQASDHSPEPLPDPFMRGYLALPEKKQRALSRTLNRIANLMEGGNEPPEASVETNQLISETKALH